VSIPTPDSPSDPASGPDRVPDDVALGEGPRNRLDHLRAAEPGRPIRELAADAALTAAIDATYQAG